MFRHCEIIPKIYVKLFLVVFPMFYKQPGNILFFFWKPHMVPDYVVFWMCPLTNLIHSPIPICLLDLAMFLLTLKSIALFLRSKKRLKRIWNLMLIKNISLWRLASFLLALQISWQNLYPKVMCIKIEEDIV